MTTDPQPNIRSGEIIHGVICPSRSRKVKPVPDPRHSPDHRNVVQQCINSDTCFLAVLETLFYSSWDSTASGRGLWRTSSFV